MTESKNSLNVDSGSFTSNTADTPPLTLGQLFWKTTSLSLIFVSIFLAITALIIAGYGWTLYQRFLNTAELTHAKVMNLYETSRTISPRSDSERTVFLILGTDTVTNKSAAPLTDTMILASVNHKSGEINTLPLPRDLWSEEYQTKINSLYTYGIERDPTNPTAFPASVLTELTSIPIHYTVVVSLEQVAQLIEVIGDVSIDVPQGFTDTKFPRQDIKLETATSEAELYETITFEAGTQKMDATRALKYIRSRQSEGDAGTDTDRSARQQLLLSSLARQILNRDILTQPEKLGMLYHWYQTNYAESLPTEDALALALVLFPQRSSLSLIPHSLSVYPNIPDGVIENPPLSRAYQMQWVYRIRDRQAFQHEVRSALGFPARSNSEDQ